MLDTQTETRQQTQETSPKIDLEILSALNLTQDDVENLDKEKIKLQQAENDGKTAGADFYRLEVAGETKQDVRVGNVTVLANMPRAEVADFVVKSLRSSGESITDPKSETSYRAKGFLDGLGNSAILNRDWKTAIASLDAITEGGVVKNEKAMNQLNSQDKANKVEIAKIIQGRRNASGTNPEPTPAVERQAPIAYAGTREPTDTQSRLRPAPTNPSSNPSNIIQ